MGGHPWGPCLIPAVAPPLDPSQAGACGGSLQPEPPDSPLWSVLRGDPTGVPGDTSGTHTHTHTRGYPSFLPHCRDHPNLSSGLNTWGGPTRGGSHRSLLRDAGGHASWGGHTHPWEGHAPLCLKRGLSPWQIKDLSLRTRVRLPGTGGGHHAPRTRGFGEGWGDGTFRGPRTRGFAPCPLWGEAERPAGGAAHRNRRQRGGACGGRAGSIGSV